MDRLSLRDGIVGAFAIVGLLATLVWANGHVRFPMFIGSWFGWFLATFLIPGGVCQLAAPQYLVPVAAVCAVAAVPIAIIRPLRAEPSPFE